MRTFLIKITSSFFYLGYIPLAPGTFGSIPAVLIAWLLKAHPGLYLLFSALVTLAGFIVSTAAEKIFNRKDAECIVIDEVAGMCLSLVFLPTINEKTLLCAFLLFRGFDTMKIYPADKLQRLAGSRGVMLDDMIAAIYTNLILQFVFRFFS